MRKAAFFLAAPSDHGNVRLIVSVHSLYTSEPWITPELIEYTRRAWQRRYRTSLTQAEAIEILVAFGRLADALTTLPYEKMPTDITS